jgi:hypothetical protein
MYGEESDVNNSFEYKEFQRQKSELNKIKAKVLENNSGNKKRKVQDSKIA